MEKKFLKEIKPEILKVLDFFDREALTQLELEMKDFSLSLKRGGEKIEKRENPEILKVPQIFTIKADKVGVFHFTLPENPVPPINAGDPVKKGQILGYIESVSLAYEVLSPVEGKVEKLLVKEGEIVEYGKPLLEVLSSKV